MSCSTVCQSLLSSAVVHTTGINWESIGAIAGIVTALFGAFTWYVARRDKAQRELVSKIEKNTSSSIDNLSTLLLEKLETKENVNQIRVDMAAIKTRVDMLIERDSHASHS